MIPNHPTAVAIVARVAALFAIPVEELWKYQRSPAMAEARHVAWWKVWKDTGWTPGEVATAAGVNRESVLYGIKKIDGQVVDGGGTTLLRQAVELLRIPWIGDWQRVDEALARHRFDGGQAGGVLQVPPTTPSERDQVSGSIPESSASPISSGSRPESKRARGGEKSRRWRFVPEDWQPKERHLKLAKELHLDIRGQELLFREHEFKDPKTDADRAFARWLRRAHDFVKPVTNGKPPGLVQHERHRAEEDRSPAPYNQRWLDR
jgi:hypothetical protein